MSELMNLLNKAVNDNASDVFIVPGGPLSYKIEGKLLPMAKNKLSPANTEGYLREIYELANRNFELLTVDGDDDFSFSVPSLARFRINAYRQRGSLAAVIRIVLFSIPNYEEIHVPSQIMELAKLTNGMILFSGTAGSGKSTTQACLIDRINQTKACHIVTLEDPIEYLYRDAKSIVSQREIMVDTQDYLSALRACLRQSPDVILLGEMRDQETVKTAITAAETGHLLITTLHTHGAVNTIDRIIDSVEPNQQSQIRTQLSYVLKTVVSQQLLPDINGDLIPAFEILHVTPAVRSLIRENKNHQIGAVIASGGAYGMISMDQYILNLYKEGKITKETALEYADNPEQMQRQLSQ